MTELGRDRKNKMAATHILFEYGNAGTGVHHFTHGKTRGGATGPTLVFR